MTSTQELQEMKRVAEGRIQEFQRIISVAVETICQNKQNEDELRLQKAIIASAKDSLYDAQQELKVVMTCLEINHKITV